METHYKISQRTQEILARECVRVNAWLSHRTLKQVGLSIGVGFTQLLYDWHGGNFTLEMSCGYVLGRLLNASVLAFLCYLLINKMPMYLVFRKIHVFAEKGIDEDFVLRIDSESASVSGKHGSAAIYFNEVDLIISAAHGYHFASNNHVVLSFQRTALDSKTLNDVVPANVRRIKLALR